VDVGRGGISAETQEVHLDGHQVGQLIDRERGGTAARCPGNLRSQVGFVNFGLGRRNQKGRSAKDRGKTEGGTGKKWLFHARN